MAFLKYFVALGLLLIIPDLYIYFVSFYRKRISKWWKICYWIPTIIILTAIFIYVLNPVRTGLRIVYYFNIFIFICIFSKLSYAIISFIGFVLSIFNRRFKKIFNHLGIIIGVIISVIVIYSFLYGYKNYKVRHITIYSEDIPSAYNNYRIVQFSDLHIGSFLKRKDNNVKQIVDLINRQNGNMIVFTGDLVNMNAQELRGYRKTLSQLKADDGVYSVLGNHDYGKYMRWRTSKDQEINFNLLKKEEYMFGWHLLLNQHIILHRGKDSIAILGVEDYGKIGPYKYGDLNKARGQISVKDKKLYKILLSHDPSFWHLKVIPTSDIQLTLSGHTHGMQLKFGSFSPSKWLFPEWGGLYKYKNQYLYVNLGIGALMSYRFGAWPEISVITLKRKISDEIFLRSDKKR